MTRALLAAAALLLAAAPARADVITADGQPVPPAWEDAAIAASYAWPAAVEHCPTVTITFTDTGPDGEWAMWADRDNCLIGARPHLRDSPYLVICPMGVHEYGHLAGFTDPANVADPYHSLDPHNIMYAGGQDWAPACGDERRIVDRLLKIEDWLVDMTRRKLQRMRCGPTYRVYRDRRWRKHCHRRAAREYRAIRNRLLVEQDSLQSDGEMSFGL